MITHPPPKCIIRVAIHIACSFPHIMTLFYEVVALLLQRHQALQGSTPLSCVDSIAPVAAATGARTVPSPA